MDIDRSSRIRLSDAQRARYLDEWAQIRRSFRDDPAEAVRAAEALMKEVEKVQGAPVSLRRINEASREGTDLGAAMAEAYNIALNARDAARGVALSRADGNASVEDLTNAISYYELLFNEVLLGDVDAATPQLPPVAIKFVGVRQQHPLLTPVLRAIFAILLIWLVWRLL